MNCCCDKKIDSSIYRGDDTSAFGGTFLEIDVINETGYNIAKAEWRCGVIFKTFENPQFPLYINLTSEETEKLNTQNTCYIALYDENGKKHTMEENLTFTSKQKKV